MYGELMRIETLVERIAELKEANRRLQTLNAELVEERDKLLRDKEHRVFSCNFAPELQREIVGCWIPAKGNETLEAEIASLKRELEEAKKGYRVADMGWGAECSRLHHENERLRKENEAYKDMFNRIRNLIEVITEDTGCVNSPCSC